MTGRRQRRITKETEEDDQGERPEPLTLGRTPRGITLLETWPNLGRFVEYGPTNTKSPSIW